MSTSENQIVVYQPNETVLLDMWLENETVWLPQLKIAELFGVQKAAISKHVKNIFAFGELVRDATVSKLETVQTEGGRMVVHTQEFFNLDVIIAVGYRVNSRCATQFRKATSESFTYPPGKTASGEGMDCKAHREVIG